ncbi:MAG: hypothetical protein E6868_00005, partial [Pantoea sp.]|uniref:hypothetical protein n=2 Tax=Pantoea TaxID=53335 RepID=UPI002902E707
GSPHARVGNCQASNCDNPDLTVRVFCVFRPEKNALHPLTIACFYLSSSFCRLKLKDFHKSHEDSTSSGCQAIVGHLDV